MSDRVRLGLELVYLALENLIIVAAADDGDGGVSLAWLLALAGDMQGAITEYWQALDVAVVGETELGR